MQRKAWRTLVHEDIIERLLDRPVTVIALPVAPVPTPSEVVAFAVESVPAMAMISCARATPMQPFPNSAPNDSVS
jgi:hypothetical protein